MFNRAPEPLVGTAHQQHVRQVAFHAERRHPAELGWSFDGEPDLQLGKCSNHRGAREARTEGVFDASVVLPKCVVEGGLVDGLEKTGG